jgi:tetratricopeptide (TPR) repeat protein
VAGPVFDLEEERDGSWIRSGVCIRVGPSEFLTCAHNCSGAHRIRLRDEHGLTSLARIISKDTQLDVAYLSSSISSWLGEPADGTPSAAFRGDEVIVTGTLGVARRAVPLPIRGRVVATSSSDDEGRSAMVIQLGGIGSEGVDLRGFSGALVEPEEQQGRIVGMIRRSPKYSGRVGFGGLVYAVTAADCRRGRASSGTDGRSADEDQPTTLTGRDDEIGAARRALDRDEDVVVTAVSGLAGIGKTALALEVVRQIEHAFEDGIAFVDLKGYTAGSNPMDLLAACSELLSQVTGKLVQPSGDLQLLEQWRRVAQSRSMLVVLDNAVRPAVYGDLIPAAGKSRFLITSRQTAATTTSTFVLRLGALPDEEARLALARMIGRDDTESRGDLADLASLAKGVPLTLRVFAALLRRHSHWTPKDLAIHLRVEPAGMDIPEGEDTPLTLALLASMEELSPQARSVLAAVGAHKGASLSPRYVAPLAGVPHGEAARAFEELFNSSLVEDMVGGGYSVHDLVRAFAARQWRELDAKERRKRWSALKKLYERELVEMISSAHTASALAVPSTVVSTWVTAEGESALAAAGSATQYGPIASRVSYLVALGKAHARFGYHRTARICLNDAYEISRRSSDRSLRDIAILELGVAARESNDFGAAEEALLVASSADVTDERIRARALEALGFVYERLGRYLEADEKITMAIGIYQADPGPNLGRALSALGAVRFREGRYAEALSLFDQALPLRGLSTDQSGVARTLNNKGLSYQRIGRLPAALRSLRMGLHIAKLESDRSVVATIYANVAFCCAVSKNGTRGLVWADRAEREANDIGDSYEMARSYDARWRCLAAAGRRTEAMRERGRTLEAYSRIRVPEATRLADVDQFRSYSY